MLPPGSRRDGRGKSRGPESGLGSITSQCQTHKNISKPKLKPPKWENTNPKPKKTMGKRERVANSWGSSDARGAHGDPAAAPKPPSKQGPGQTPACSGIARLGFSYVRTPPQTPKRKKGTREKGQRRKREIAKTPLLSVN